MEIETLGNRQSFSEKSWSFNTSLAEFDLTSLIDNMKDSSSWKDGELKTRVILNSPGRQIVLTIMHEGTEIDSFQTGDSVTFQIVEGRIRFRTRKESVFLNKGQLLTLHENIKYNLTTREETILLLTLANDNLKQMGI